jgi:hypothetical protein
LRVRATLKEFAVPAERSLSRRAELPCDIVLGPAVLAGVPAPQRRRCVSAVHILRLSGG